MKTEKPVILASRCHPEDASVSSWAEAIVASLG